MKSILISINPQHAVNILNGSKTLELRKSVPKDFVGWVYMYVTKGGITIYKNKVEYDYVQGLGNVVNSWNNPRLNGKVVARWWFDGYDVVEEHHLINQGETWFTIGNDGSTFYNKLCLNVTDVSKYLGMNNGYAWHISKLEILDKPMGLGEFETSIRKVKSNYDFMGTHFDYVDSYERKDITKAPQSWQYVWVKEKL